MTDVEPASAGLVAPAGEVEGNGRRQGGESGSWMIC